MHLVRQLVEPFRQATVNMTERLNAAIERAYEAFGSRRLEGRLEVCHCECCMTEEMARSIQNTPLRDLSNEQLSEYTNSAHGWSDQFLYLLPRYMELVSHGQRPTYLDADHIFSRFRYAPEHCMTGSENAAFAEWLLALFEATLCSPISVAELECAQAGRGGTSWSGFGSDLCEVIEIALPPPFDTNQLQAVWDSCKSREANLRLASTLIFGIGAQRFHDSCFFLPGRAREAATGWYEWFTLTDHTQRLSEAFEQETDSDAKEFLLAAI